MASGLKWQGVGGHRARGERHEAAPAPLSARLHTQPHASRVQLVVAATLQQRATAHARAVGRRRRRAGATVRGAAAPARDGYVAIVRKARDGRAPAAARALRPEPLPSYAIAVLEAQAVAYGMLRGGPAARGDEGDGGGDEASYDALPPQLTSRTAV